MKLIFADKQSEPRLFIGFRFATALRKALRHCNEYEYEQIDSYEQRISLESHRVINPINETISGVITVYCLSSYKRWR